MQAAVGRKARIPAIFRRRGDPLTVSENERRVLEIVRRSGVTSRADLTRATSLAPQSISRLIEALMKRGLVEFGEKRVRGRGHPGLEVRLVRTAVYSAGVSIRTEGADLAVVGFDGTVLAERRLEPEAMDIDAVIRSVDAKLEEVFSTLDLDRRRLFGIGLAMSGFFTSQAGRMNPPDPLAHWSTADLEQTFMRALDLPVWLENDGNASAIGESLCGTGLTHASFAYLYFTYGLGGGVVIDGSLVRGAFGNAGEFSAMLPPERHAQRPTLESLRRLLCDTGLEVATIADLQSRFDPNWPGIAVWLDRVQGPLSDIISAISGVIDPAAIVFGGQIPPALAERLIAGVVFHNQARRGEARPTPAMVVSPLRGNAAAIGAASMPLKYAFFL